MINTVENWQKFYRPMEKSGWCGPAVVQMALLAGGFEVSQAEIADDIYLNWWGVFPQAMIAHLSGFYKRLNCREESCISDIAAHLQIGHIVIVDWFCNLDGNESEDDGHYSITTNVEKDHLWLVDPDPARGIWRISKKNFIGKWFDYLDLNKTVPLVNWMLWIDPDSKIVG